MVSSQIIKKSIDELAEVTGCTIRVIDITGHTLAATDSARDVEKSITEQFIASAADSQTIGELLFFKIFDDGELLFILVVSASDGIVAVDPRVVGRICANHLQELAAAYKERYDRGGFIQNLLLDNLLRVDIYNRARKLHIDTQVPRVVIVVETKAGQDQEACEYLTGMFGGGHDIVTAVEECHVAVVRELTEKVSEGYGKTVPSRDGLTRTETVVRDEEQDPDRIARMISDNLNTEALINVRVAYGTVVNELADLSKSYKEARMALDVGKIFYPKDRVSAYNTLGIGRLIYQLPENLCRLFIQEIFKESGTLPEIDEETRITVDRFFENNLNVSETARQLFVHRNTLVYRIEKLQKSTGLDIRCFDDALTFKIATMVMNYLRYLEKRR